MLPLSKAPTAAQVTEALDLYNDILREVRPTDGGENLRDWPLGNFGIDDPGAFTDTIDPYILARPWLNSRLIATNIGAITVFLPPRPQDGSRIGMVDPYGRLAANPVLLDGNGRTITGTATLLLNVNSVNQYWMYRADQGGWVAVAPVLATDPNPYPDEFNTYFKIYLAMRLGPGRYGRNIDEMTQQVFSSARRNFQARYIQSQPLELDDSISWPFMSKQGYDSQSYGAYSSTNAFNRGNPLDG